MTPFPWGEAMRIGFGVLRLAPDQFWAMTPRELAAAIDGLKGTTQRASPPSRERFEDLMRAFPDTTDREVNNG